MKNKKNSTFWVFIPARSESKSIKHKNIKILKNKPLLAFSIISAKKLKISNKIVVSSDSKKYLKIAKKYGSNFIHPRPKKLAKDKTTDLEVFKDFIKYLLKKKIKPPDYFIHLRPTTPLRKIKTLNRAINHFKKNSKNFTSMRSVSLMSHPSFKTMKIVRGKLCSIFLGIDPSININSDLDKYNKPKEFFEKTFLPNGYIDIVKTKNIVKNQFHGNKVLPFITDEFNSDIDNYNDYIKVKRHLE